MPPSFCGRVLYLGLLCLLPHDASAEQTPRTIGAVAWLQGCWQDATPARTVEEQWTAPLGDSMLGTGRTVRAGRLVDFELVVLRQKQSDLVYEAYPAGQPAAMFPAKTVARRSIVFENLSHDFPQRIGYEGRDPSALLAWIEGLVDGAQKRIEFRYRRVPCS